MFKTFNTSDSSTDKHNTLIMAPHGFGKTKQAEFYAEAYGAGIILSGEGGLRTLKGADIDYVPFTSFKEPGDETSFRSILGVIKRDPEFAAKGYKWIVVDSLNELAEMAYREKDKEINGNATKPNPFAVYSEYASEVGAAIKVLKDLPYHILVTSLVRSKEDDNGNTYHQPLVKGQDLQRLLPGIFDNVFCGVRRTIQAEEGPAKVQRYIVTDEVNGWAGKYRGKPGTLKPIEDTGNVTELHAKIDAALAS